MTHRLSEKNPDARTAICSVCGPVAIFKNGSYWTCATAKKARMKQWAQRNPEAAKANRAGNSTHFLSFRSADNSWGFCDKCEASVSLSAYGRGYACAVRTSELRDKVEDAPQAKCLSCGVYPTGQQMYQGRCLPCAADLLLQQEAVAGTHVSTWADYRDPEALSFEGEYLDGFSVVQPDFDPYHDDNWEPVPGWKAIGSDRPWNEV